MKSIFDRTFHYVPSVQTDIRKTIHKELKRLRDEKARREAMPDSEGKVFRFRAATRKVVDHD